MVTFTCPRCDSRQQVDSLLNFDSASFGFAPGEVAGG